MNTVRKSFVLGASLAALFLADVAPDEPRGLQLAPAAHAIIGAPLTPMSYAGVARRTTRRVVAVEATAATAATASAAQQQAQQQQAQQQQAQQQAQPPKPAAGAPAIGTVVTSLPPGCAPIAIKGVEYYNCGPGVFYRAAFQGNNLVYVATQP